MCCRSSASWRKGRLPNIEAPKSHSGSRPRPSDRANMNTRLFEAADCYLARLHINHPAEISSIFGNQPAVAAAYEGVRLEEHLCREHFVPDDRAGSGCGILRIWP